MTLIRSLALIFAASVLMGGIARADTCTPISVVPTVITSPGTYCVTGYLTTSQATGVAIEIQADNVVLDFGGWGIDGFGGGIETQAFGVYALDRNNITIQNGTIRGFLGGIALENSAGDFANTSGHRVTQMLIEGNRSAGVEIRGAGTEVTNNLIDETGGTSLYGASAIVIYGPDALIAQNNIPVTTTLTADSEATGVFLFGAPRCQVNGNRIAYTEGAPQYSTGVMVWNSPDCVVSRNEFDNGTTSPLDVGVYVIDSKRVQTISNKMTNVVKNVLR